VNLVVQTESVMVIPHLAQPVHKVYKVMLVLLVTEDPKVILTTKAHEDHRVMGTTPVTKVTKVMLV